MLSHETQPFVYAGYTIFVAEVPSTLNEALLLDFMLARAKTREERIVLLQHAIDGIVGTFYNQVLFADFELEAHRLVEQDQPITSETLSGIYAKLLGEYWGDALSPDPRAQHTWARIPHFFQSPYYVYQYATCFASTAKLMEEIGSGDAAIAQGRGRSLSQVAAVGRLGSSDDAAARAPASISASRRPCEPCRHSSTASSIGWRRNLPGPPEADATGFQVRLGYLTKPVESASRPLLINPQRRERIDPHRLARRHQRGQRRDRQQQRAARLTNVIGSNDSMP